MLYTGLDYHRSFSCITTMNDRGEIISQKKLPSNGQIIDFLKEFDDSMEGAIEARGFYASRFYISPFFTVCLSR